MKTKELKTKLARLQSRAYNLQAEISRLISELDSEKVKLTPLEKKGLNILLEGVDKE